VLKETGDSLGCETPTKGEDQIIIGQFSIDLTVRENYAARFRFDSCYFSLDKSNAPIEHRLAEIERNIIRLTFAKCESDKFRVEDELRTPRHQCDLMFFGYLAGERFGSYYATKPSTQD
jgi:hypothetical protein